MDLKSQMGYAYNSPFRNNPYLDINTPEGVITMENTPIDLMGIDNLGNVKKMKAGRKNPYKFPGNQVREIPMQRGGKAPIYTSNPNDPRIKAYNDSLNIYNKDQQYQKASNKWALAEYDLWNQTGHTDDYTLNRGAWKDLRSAKDKELSMLDSILRVAANKSSVPNDPNEEIPEYVFNNVYDDKKKGFNTTINGQSLAYKHPVQPVVYKKSNMSGRPSDIPFETLNIPQGMDMNIPARSGITPTDSTTPTKFSVTYPEGNNQKTIYYKDKETWKAAVKGVKGASSQEGSDYGTATGYLKKGGINPYQTGGNVLDFLFDDEDDDEDTAPAQQQQPEEQQQDDNNELIAAKVERQNFEKEQEELALQQTVTDQNPYRTEEHMNFDEEGDETPTAPAKGVNPYVLKSESDLMGQFNVKSLGIWGDKSHQARKSDHNTGDAEDFAFDKPDTALSSIAQLQKEAKERNVKYIIYNGKIWNPSISNEWRPYNGSNPHNSHFHVSYNR